MATASDIYIAHPFVATLMPLGSRPKLRLRPGGPILSIQRILAGT